MADWLTMLEQLGFYDGEFGRLEAKKCFIWSQMRAPPGSAAASAVAGGGACLRHTDFAEALARVATFKALPADAVFARAALAAAPPPGACSRTRASSGSPCRGRSPASCTTTSLRRSRATARPRASRRRARAATRAGAPSAARERVDEILHATCDHFEELLAAAASARARACDELVDFRRRRTRSARRSSRARRPRATRPATGPPRPPRPPSARPPRPPSPRPPCTSACSSCCCCCTGARSCAAAATAAVSGARGPASSVLEQLGLRALAADAERELAEHARADARERRAQGAHGVAARRPSFSERWLAERDLEQGADVDADSGLSTPRRVRRAPPRAGHY